MLKRTVSFINGCLDPNNILIYQMGKVGSTSLEKAIPNSTHFHTLYQRRICQFYVDQILPTWWCRIKHSVTSKIRVFLYRRRSKVKILTLVRNPFERNVSHFFQDLQFWISGYTLQIRDFRVENDNLVIDCFENSFNFEYAKYWFDEEIKRFSNIDVMKSDFNIEKGIGVVKQGKYELLIVRMDKLKDLQDEISHFIGFDINVQQSNSGGAKWYKCIYSSFRHNYQPTESILKDNFDIGWVRKFFSNLEIDDMKNKALQSYKK